MCTSVVAAAAAVTVASVQSPFMGPTQDDGPITIRNILLLRSFEVNSIFHVYARSSAKTDTYVHDAYVHHATNYYYDNFYIIKKKIVFILW